jgi:hypothetical protein
VPGKEPFVYFNVKDFVPDQWKNEYPLAAFSRMTERDGAWMARILARFTPTMVRALAEMADYSKRDDIDYLDEVLEGRLRRILDRYLTRLSSIADLHIEAGDRLCGVDLAESSGVRGPDAFHYVARVIRQGWVTVERRRGGGVCAKLPHVVGETRLVDAAPQRYVRVRIEDGVAKGPLVVHLYDLGPTRGYRLVGVERPTE